MTRTHPGPYVWGQGPLGCHTETSPAQDWAVPTPTRMAVLGAGTLTASCLLVVSSRVPLVAFSAYDVTSDRSEDAAPVSTTEAFIPAAATAKSVRELKERSGLTWDQLAKAFSVSRRSVHGWASGARMNAANAELLARLTGALSQVEVPGDTDATRAAILPVLLSLAPPTTDDARRGPSPLDRISVRHEDELWRSAAGERITMVDSD